MPTPILALAQSLRWHHYIMQYHDAPVPPTMPVLTAVALSKAREAGADIPKPKSKRGSKASY